MTTLGTRSLYPGPPPALDALGDEAAAYFRHLHESLFGVGVGALGNLNANHMAIEGRETLTPTGRNPLITADPESGALSAREGVALGEVATDSDGLLVGTGGAVEVASEAVASGYIEHTLTAGYEALEHVPLDDAATDAGHVWSAEKIAAAISGSGGTGTVGTVTSVDVSGGTTGLTTSGGPVTTAGTITLAGTLAVANGGTGATSLAAFGLVANPLSQFAATTSAQLAGVISNKTGAASGTPLLVFNVNPTLTGATMAGVLDMGGQNITNIATPSPQNDGITSLGSAAKQWLNLHLSGGIKTTGGTVTITLPTVTSTLLYSGGPLGTPSSGTLTNCTGLPVAGITASTVTALGVGSIELGHASDTTLTRVSAGVVAVEGSNILLASGLGSVTQAYDADLASWAGVTRAAGFDTFAATPTSANFATLIGGDLAVADGGTGRSTGTTAYALIATGTTATGAQQTLASGATTEVLVGGGASALPVWTTATGSGAPVRATSPTLVTPVLGAATGTSLALTGAASLVINQYLSLNGAGAGYRFGQTASGITLGHNTFGDKIAMNLTELFPISAGLMALGSVALGYSSLFLDEAGAGTQTAQIIAPTLSADIVLTTPSATGTLARTSGDAISVTTLHYSRTVNTTLSNGANNDVANPGTSYWRLDAGPTAAFSITGIVPATDGQVLIINNRTGQNMTIATASASSSLANRIYTSTGADMATTGNGTVTLIYDSTLGGVSGWVLTGIET